MSIKKISKNQPDNFEFTSNNLENIKNIISNYPEKKQQSAVMALLYIAQRQNDNWIPLAAIKCIARILEMPYIKVYEVATFYSMYNLKPVGKYFIQICTTTPCMIRGAYKLVEACKEKISKNQNEFLEEKRSSFPRFYFIGDDDLLEILGQAQNPTVIQRHLKKLFQGLHKVEFSEDKTRITAMCRDHSLIDRGSWQCPRS